MQMPGRHGFATETGDWHGSYGYYLPDYISVNFRNNNTPPEYTARIQVALDNGFSTGASSDNYVVYISDSAMQATLDSAYQLVGNGYRYRFNGQEHSTELGNDDYTAQFWEYDGRSGRRWNLDPKPTVGLSEYATFGNNPIRFSDVLGDTPMHEIDGKMYNLQKNNTGKIDFVDKNGTKLNEKNLNNFSKALLDGFNKMASTKNDNVQKRLNELLEISNLSILYLEINYTNNHIN